ncbi:MAG: twin transmembrane helix small protein [Zetaproteobacteria bacterium]|nr:MAG: twin transmembrane helix small protein [Zetaproteobacteria bacterium]
MKIVIIVFLILILGSLGSALFYLMKDKGTGDRTVKALTLRVALSVSLFLFLMLGYWLGLLPQGRP